MDSARKIELLDEQIAEANDGSPADFELWRQKTGVVLRTVLGDANPLCVTFRGVKYSLGVYSSSTPDSAFRAARVRGVQQAVSILRASKLEVELTGGAPEPANEARSVGRDVFIVHGHDDATKFEVARFVEALTGNTPIILHEQANGGRTLIEKFEQHAGTAGFALVLATADDVGRAVHGDESMARPRARQNVVFEMGFFFGSLGRGRVAVLHDLDVSSPSDIDGLVYVPLDPAGAWKLPIARELRAAGIPVRWEALESA